MKLDGSKPRRAAVTLPAGSEEWPLEEPAIIVVPWNASLGRARVELHPKRRAAPFALLTWGYRPESAIHSISIGSEEQLLVSVPGGAFPCMVEYEEFSRLCDRRLDGHDAVRCLWRLFSYQALDLPPVELGAEFSIELEGPFDHVVFLAKMPVLDTSKEPRP